MQERRRPEDVAALVLSLLQGQLSVKQQKILEGAAKHSFYKGLSSMNTQYVRLVGADRLVDRSSKLFGLEAEAPSPSECLNLGTVENWLTRLKALLHVTLLNFHQGRLSREQQREVGFNSKRAYNRRSWFKGQPKHTHIALDDARGQGMLFMAMLRDQDRVKLA